MDCLNCCCRLEDRTIPFTVALPRQCSRRLFVPGLSRVLVERFFNTVNKVVYMAMNGDDEHGEVGPFFRTDFDDERCDAMYNDQGNELRCMRQEGHPGVHESARMVCEGDHPDIRIAWEQDTDG